MNYFISGGCKNGKSYYAQRVAKEMSQGYNICASSKEIEKTSSGESIALYYLATMRATDDEDKARIKRHIEERAGWGFITIEQPQKICECLHQVIEGESVEPKGAFLLDSVTALLSNEMFRLDGAVDLDAPRRVAEELKEFARLTGNTVFVSDYIYSDAKIYDELTEKYRKGLAYIDRELAKACDKVIEVAYSQVILHK